MHDPPRISEAVELLRGVPRPARRAVLSCGRVTRVRVGTDRSEPVLDALARAGFLIRRRDGGFSRAKVRDRSS
jgi:hypothetical protein